MRVINIIVIDVYDGTIVSIDSFGVFEEKLINDIVIKAEKLFIKKCRLYNSELTTTNINNGLDNNYIEIGTIQINIIWTDI